MAKHSSAHTIIRDGFTSIARSPAFAFAAGVVAFLAAGMLIATIAVYGFSTHVRASIAEKVDMNVYFFPSTDTEIVDLFAQVIAERPEVTTTHIISREDALEAFKERHATDALTLQALDELNDNPLGASVVINTHEPNQLKTIALLLTDDTETMQQFAPYIERVNYFDHDMVISRFDALDRTIKLIMVVLVIGVLLLTILFMYTMAKVHMVADYDAHETKALLGAHTAAIVAPKILSHMVVAAVSGTLAIIVSIIASWQLSNKFADFFEGFRFDTFLLQSLVLTCVVVYSILFLCAIGTTLIAYATTSRNR